MLLSGENASFSSYMAGYFQTAPVYTRGTTSSAGIQPEQRSVRAAPRLLPLGNYDPSDDHPGSSGKTEARTVVLTESVTQGAGERGLEACTGEPRGEEKRE